MVAEALTGRLPFRGPNLGEMLRAVATQPFAMETATPAQERVAAILGRALEKKPAERYPDAQALRAELIPALVACEPFG
jgi:serine/threonine-protein kinase